MSCCTTMQCPKYTKGSIVQTREPLWIRCVENEHDDDWTRRLPRNNAAIFPPLLCPASRQFLKHHSPNMSIWTVVACLEIVQNNKVRERILVSSETSNNDSRVRSEAPYELLLEAWTLVTDCIEFNNFKQLYMQVYRQIRVFDVPIVSNDYATRTVFELNNKELHEACHLVLDDKSPQNEHALSQALLQMTMTVIVVTPWMPHSCLPTVTMDYNHTTGTLEWIALYDIDDGSDITESRIDTSLTKEQREVALREAYGVSDYTCDCIKCSADKDNATSVKTTQLLRLGHAALVQERYDEARRWYYQALERDSSLSHVWHALGATYLQQGRFLKAQSVWKEASRNHANHEGIALQVQKQHAYRYFVNRENNIVKDTTSKSPLPSFTDVFSSGLCFTTDTSVVTDKTCRQVIQWAESCPSQWTTSRHYAVPTNDVPVHVIPELLHWFNDWMETCIYPLLAKQFHLLSNCFHVHDAFVVRYQASLESNHLPMHNDESTHSLVLVLNDDFEGGGTYFLEKDTIVNPKTPGSLISFRGDKLLHGGQVVTKGVRYIMAVFLYYDEECLEEDNGSVSSRKRNRKSWETSKDSGFSFGFSV